MYKHKKFDSDDKNAADFMLEIEEYIEKPEHYLENIDYNHGSHMFLFNPQLVFFGVPSYLLKNVSRTGSVFC